MYPKTIIFYISLSITLSIFSECGASHSLTTYTIPIKFANNISGHCTAVIPLGNFSFASEGGTSLGSIIRVINAGVLQRYPILKKDNHPYFLNAKLICHYTQHDLHKTYIAYSNSGCLLNYFLEKDRTLKEMYFVCHPPSFYEQSPSYIQKVLRNSSHITTSKKKQYDN